MCQAYCILINILHHPGTMHWKQKLVTWQRANPVKKKELYKVSERFSLAPYYGKTFYDVEMLFWCTTTVFCQQRSRPQRVEYRPWISECLKCPFPGSLSRESESALEDPLFTQGFWGFARVVQALDSRAESEKRAEASIKESFVPFERLWTSFFDTMAQKQPKKKN